MSSGVPVVLCAAVTGFATLLAETLWIRALGRSVGNTAEALAAVAAVVLGGLGAGAAIGGRRAARSPRPLREAAVASALAGAWILVSPWTLSASEGLHARVLAALDAPLGPGAGAAALVAMPFLLPPALFLGAVIPLLVAARTREAPSAPASEARWSGAIYGASTAAAALGPLGAALGLMALGETATLRVGGALCVAAAALLLLPNRTVATAFEPRATVRLRPAPRVVAFATGGAALLAQVAWFRLLGPIAGTHVFGVAALLFSTLLATGVGALLGGRLVRRRDGASLGLAALLLAVASLATAASLVAAGWAPWLLLVHGSASASARVLGLAGAVLLTVAPACLLFGAAYPVTVRAAVPDGSGHGAAAGEVFGWNAAGSIAGGIAGGFLLLPRAGAPTTILLAAAVAAVAGLAAASASKRPLVASAWAVLPLAAIAVPAVERALRESAPALPEVAAAAEPRRAGLRLASRDDVRLYADLFVGRVLDQEEGRSGTVGLLDEPGTGWRLRRGEMPEGLIDPLDPGRPTPVEDALGLLPALMHPRPRRALVIGHGVGWTAEALLGVPGVVVDVAESDAAVLDVVARARDVSLAVRSDPRARWLPADGRRVLREAARSHATYDVIASQPSRPWATGSSALFTVEAFRGAREALSPGGILAQWIDAADADAPTLRSALAAFREAFPDAWGFRFDQDLVVLGFTAPPAIDPARWTAVLDSRPPERRDWKGPSDLFKHLAFDAAGLARLVEDAAPPATDDRPRVEMDLGLDRFVGLRPSPSDALAAAFPTDVLSLLPEESLPEKTGSLERTVRERWGREATAAWLAEGRFAEANRWSKDVRWSAGADALRVRGDVARAGGNLVRAEEFYRAAVDEAPDRPELLLPWARALGALFAGRRVEEPALERVATAADRFPRRGDVLAAVGRMWADALWYERARDTLRLALDAKEPAAPPGTGVFLARLLLASGEGDEAAVLPLLRADPGALEDREGLRLLWHFETRLGDGTTARRLGEALVDLERRLGARRLRDAERAFRTGALRQALDASAAATDLLPGSSRAWEERALALLAWAATPELAEDAREDARSQAAAALRQAVDHAEDPGVGRERAHAIARWHGLVEAAVDDPTALAVPEAMP